MYLGLLLFFLVPDFEFWSGERKSVPNMYKVILTNVPVLDGVGDSRVNKFLNSSIDAVCLRLQLLLLVLDFVLLVGKYTSIQNMWKVILINVLVWGGLLTLM